MEKIILFIFVIYYIRAKGVYMATDELKQLTDLLAHVETVLAAIRGVLENKVTADIASYQLAGRLVTKIPLPELLAFQDKYEVKQDNITRRINSLSENGDSAASGFKVAF